MAFGLRQLGVAAAAAAAVGSVLFLPGQALAANPGLSAPTLVSPANDPSATSPLKDVVLSWDKVAGATQYQVQVSPNGQWTNNSVTLPNSGETVNTSYDVPLSLPHASYFWRVRAEAGSTNGPWSSVRQFLHDWDAASNVDGSFSMTALPGPDALFAWTPVPEASEYLVRVSQYPDFPTGSGTFDCVTAATALEPYELDSGHAENIGGDCFNQTNLVNGTTYYWKVRPYDDSSAAPITADTNNDPLWQCDTAQPECDGVTQSGQFTFQAPVAGATAPATAPTGLAATWNTTAGSNDCTAGLCPTTPTLSWNPVANANYYDVHVYLDPDLTNTFRDYRTPYTSLTPRDLYFGNQAGRSYYWTVTAGQCVNSASDRTCAAPQATTATTCPSGSGTSSPVISSISATPTTGPAEVAGNSQESVTITGSNFQDGACVLASGGSVSNVTVASAGEIDLTWNTPIGDAKQQVTFTVTNPDGSTSAASPAITVDPAQRATFNGLPSGSTFKVQTGQVSLTGPADGATLAPSDLGFAWTDYLADGGQGAFDARNYDLQVAKDANFDNVVLDDATVDMTRDDLATALPSGTYYWRVAPIDESGNTLLWSAARQVTVDATPPKVSISSHSVSVSSSVVLSSSEPLTGVVTGADSPSFHLVSANGGNVSGTVTKLSSTRYQLQPDGLLVTGESYTLAVAGAVTDAVGNPAVVGGSGLAVSKVADDRSPAWHFTGHWTRHHSSAAKGGSYVTAAKGAAAAVTVAGSTATLFGCRAPGWGTETVSVDGKKVVSLSLAHHFTQCGVKLWAGSLKSGEHRVTVTVTKGTGDIDEVVVG